MAIHSDVEIKTAKLALLGQLSIPDSPRGVVLFAHGSGSGRLSPRNRFVAERLQEAGLATLLMDLLEDWESNDRYKVFDIDLLAQRLLLCTNWIDGKPEFQNLALGYFGASTGAGAALQAAALHSGRVAAVVSRGGRPDLAMRYLERVKAPTLLLVGGNDGEVIDLNRKALARLTAAKDLRVIEGAGHLFEEPGTLEEVAELAANWFVTHFEANELHRSPNLESLPENPMREASAPPESEAP